MNNEKVPAAAMLRMERIHWDVPVRVELSNYLRFSRRLDGQLQELVARWAPKNRRPHGGPRRRASF